MCVSATFLSLPSFFHILSIFVVFLLLFSVVRLFTHLIQCPRRSRLDSRLISAYTSQSERALHYQTSRPEIKKIITMLPTVHQQLSKFILGREETKYFCDQTNHFRDRYNSNLHTLQDPTYYQEILELSHFAYDGGKTAAK